MLTRLESPVLVFRQSAEINQPVCAEFPSAPQPAAATGARTEPLPPHLSGSRSFR
jgi:hypothetical protein